MAASAATAETGAVDTDPSEAWSEADEIAEPESYVEPAWKNWFIVGTVLAVGATIAAVAAVGVGAYLQDERRPSETSAVTPPTTAPATTTPAQLTTTASTPPEPKVTTVTVTPSSQTPWAASVGDPCDPYGPAFTSSNGESLACVYAGPGRARWANSVPIMGVRVPGTHCDSDDGRAAVTPDGRHGLLCVGVNPSATWSPGA